MNKKFLKIFRKHENLNFKFKMDEVKIIQRFGNVTYIEKYGIPLGITDNLELYKSDSDRLIKINNEQLTKIYEFLHFIQINTCEELHLEDLRYLPQTDSIHISIDNENTDHLFRGEFTDIVYLFIHMYDKNTDMYDYEVYIDKITINITDFDRLKNIMKLYPSIFNIKNKVLCKFAD